MAHLTLVATLTARPGSAEPLKAILSAMVAPSRQEPGCIRYDLHQDPEHPEVLVFLETWESREAHAAHKLTPHFLAGRARQEGLVAERHVRALEQVI